MQIGTDVKKNIETAILNKTTSSAGSVGAAAHPAPATAVFKSPQSEPEPQTLVTSLSPLYLAIQNGELRKVQALIRAGEKVSHRNFSGKTPKQFASAQGHKYIAEILERQEAYELRSAVTGNRINEIKNLLLNDINLNFVFGKGWTILHFACQQGKMGIVKLLILNGARNDLKTSEGRTAYEYLPSGSEQLNNKIQEEDATVKEPETLLPTDYLFQLNNFMSTAGSSAGNIDSKVKTVKSDGSAAEPIPILTAIKTANSIYVPVMSGKGRRKVAIPNSTPSVNNK